MGRLNDRPATGDAAAHVVKLLTERGLTVSTAESLTGGLIAGALTAIPGASACVSGGFVTYTDEIKHRVLGIPRALLADPGAVSEPVALAMAQSARERLGTDFALSATGYAGPGGDTGLVWLGLASSKHLNAWRFNFSGDRAAVRASSVRAALALLIDTIASQDGRLPL